ncbi:MAG: hypothetical protein FJX72_19110 [Armatimonadetes bacterium]|nr:hypothetical protein [Armatimonadota bacterium]
MLDVRNCARDLVVPQIDLVREMQADGVPLLPVSAKRWRVAETDWLAWISTRQAKAADEARQRQLRMQHVAGEGSPLSARAGSRKARFRR